MVNQQLFTTTRGKLVPATNTINAEGAPAYALDAKQALAQYAATGTLTTTFYSDGREQLADVLRLTSELEPAYVARTAVWCREHGYMKDMPALLLAVLSTRDTAVFERTFARVVDNGKMLRNFVQIMRSGAVGRKSLGSAPKRAVVNWLETRSEDELLRASIGTTPSLGDVVKMVHPKPATDARRAFYAWLIGREFVEADLPELVRSFETKKRDPSAPLPALSFEMLSSLELTTEDWTSIAANATWTQTRMNLNTFARHGVFGAPVAKESPRGGELAQALEGIRSAVRKAFSKALAGPNAHAEITAKIAERLRDKAAIERARVFPYQLLTAYLNCDDAVPLELREALQDALEIATQNVPAFEGRLVVCPDVSGSMSSPVTGMRKGATSKVRCIDVAGLVAACVLRKNPKAQVLPFENGVCNVRLNPRDSVMTNAAKLGAIGGGGTNCSAPIKHLNDKGESADVVIFVSDNQSWLDVQKGRGTALMSEWAKLQTRAPNAKLVCLDIQPFPNTQAAERADILNIGGFSDHVFTLIEAFAAGRLGSGHWVEAIEAVAL